jgi:hypothetical protein
VLARHGARYREPPVGPARSVATVASTVAWSAAPARFLARLPRRSRPSKCSLVALRARRLAHPRRAVVAEFLGVHVRILTTRAGNGTGVAVPEGVRALEGAALQVAKPLTAVDDALARLRWILFAVTIGDRRARRGRARRGVSAAAAPKAAPACGWRCLLSEFLPASQWTLRLDEPHIRHDQITTDRRRGGARRLRRLR